jgi:hypothetical protein
MPQRITRRGSGAARRRIPAVDCHRGRLVEWFKEPHPGWCAAGQGESHHGARGQGLRDWDILGGGAAGRRKQEERDAEPTHGGPPKRVRLPSAARVT